MSGSSSGDSYEPEKVTVKRVVVRSQKVSAMTSYEKNLALDLISYHKEIIESKNTDTNTIRNKGKAWKEIEKSFVSDRNTTQRTAEQLRIWWRNCKLRSKDELKKHRQALQRGSCSKSRSSRLGTETEKIYEIVSAQMSPLPDGINLIEDEEEVKEEQDDSDDHEAVDMMTTDSFSSLANGKQYVLNPIEIDCSQEKTTNSLSDMQYKEHQIRLKILSTELETAKINRQKAEFELHAINDEHQLRMQVLASKLTETEKSVLS